MTDVVQLDAVSKAYPGGVIAVDKVSLSIGNGELAAIVGPSGSGKSTLLHLIGTLDVPSSGTARIAGFDTVALCDRALSALRATTIGFVFQQFHLPSGVTAVDAVGDGLLYSGIARAERRERAVAALERVGLGNRLSHRPHELSGGERQRVAIARAVVKRPALILADEPTGNLDSASARAVIDLLRQLHGAGNTVLVITHDHDIARSLPRRIEMRDGRIANDTGSRETAAR